MKIKLSREESRIFRALNTPQKIQDFLETIPANRSDTCFSPRTVLKKQRAHCMEGAMLAAAILRFHGHPPLIVDFESTKKDLDHVVAVFKIQGFWGAISKTNHAVLRYRDPVYRSIRELAMSYFHEYFFDNGAKTLRTFSRPINLSRFDRLDWITSANDVWYVPEHLTKIPHTRLLTKSHILHLRKADSIERKAASLVQWKKQ